MPSFASLIYGLAGIGVDAQEALDAAWVDDALRWARARNAAGPAPPGAPVPEPPERLVLGRFEAEANVEVTARRSVGVRLGIDLLGKPLTTFSEYRYEHSRTQRNRVSVELERVPLPRGKLENGPGTKEG